MRWPAAAFGLATPLAPWAASAQLVMSGSVTHPRTLTEADLQAMPPTSLELSYETGKGPERATYIGALPWTLLGQAELVDQPGKRTHTLHTIVARGRDGYAVALALGELDPFFEGKQVIVAYARDGNRTEPRLIVPGDKHGGRAVHDLIEIEVR